MDFNRDGHIDIVTATFDGSPYVSFGDGKTYAQPSHLLDKNGQRMYLKQYWDYDKKQWAESSQGFVDGLEPQGHACSAVAFDWDGDGILDLILADKDSGRLYLRRNQGIGSEYSFSTINEPILAGGKPVAIQGGITAPELVDWDGDHKLDILVGSFHGKAGDEKTSGVWLLRNTSTSKKLSFAAPVALIAPEKHPMAPKPMRPEEGLYVDAKDFDGDGKRDLLVGGYHYTKAITPELTDGQTARITELQALVKGLNSERWEHIKKAQEGDEETYTERYKEMSESAEYKEIEGNLADATKELETLAPKPKRGAGVWFYRAL